MKRAPRLRLEPRPSRIAAAAVIIGAIGTASVVFIVPLPWWGCALALLVIACVVTRELVTCAGRGVPAFLIVGDDRRITVCGRDGRTRDGEILDASYVGASLTTILWRTDGAPWWRPASTLLILPDMLGREDFRRLRVLLRYGAPASRARSNGVAADRPSSQARASIRAPLSPLDWFPSKWR